MSLSYDIYTLKNVLLESFVLFEEASSRERRRNDHSYITMLKERALDPITAKRMQKINQVFQYLSTQLQEVNNKLDQDWILHMSNKKNMTNFRLSSTEAIYKTIVNNQKIIYNWKKKVDWLLKKAEEKKLRNITNCGSWNRHHKKSPREDLSKLADEFLQVKITQKDDGENSVTKKLSSESQNFLINFLKKSSVVTVRPTAVYSPSQSRLLSNTMLSDDTSGLEQTQDKTISLPPEKEKNENVADVSEVQSADTMPRLFKENTLVKTYCPVYEPITPPEIDSNVPEPTNKTFTFLSKENKPETLPHLSSVSPTGSLDKGICSGQLSGGKSNNGLQNSPFTSQMQSPIFNWTVSETSSAPTIVSSSTFTFSTSIQKDSEFTTSRPLTYSNSSTSLPVSSFQFGQKRDSFWSTSTVVSSSASSTLKPSLTDNVSVESSQLAPPNKSVELFSNATFAVTTSSNASSILPVAKTTFVPKPILKMTEEKKSSNVQNYSNPSAIPPIENRAEISFEIDKSEQKKKGDNAPISAFQSMGDFSFTLNSANKSISAVTKSSNFQEQETFADSEKCTNNSTSFNIPSKQAVISTDLETDGVIDLSNQSKESSSDSNELKQEVSLSAVSSELTKIAPSTSVVESDTNTIAITSLVSLATSQSPPPPPSSSPATAPLSTLHPQNTPSSSTVLFEQTVSTVPSTSSKSNESTTSSFQSIGQLQSETPSFFSSSKSDDCTSSETSTTQTPFGQQPISTTTPQVNAFGQPTPTLTQTPLGQPSTTTVAQTNLFGQPTVTTATQTTLFGQPVTTSQTTFFGQPTSTSNFSSTSGGFFSQTPSFGTDMTSAVTTTSSNFNTQSTAFSFAKPAFGQATGSFGLAKSLFGQETPSFTQAATPSSFSFNQTSSNAFGQGSFFSGLGGKPSEENASKNVFGITSGIKPSDTNNLFKNSSIKSFGSANGNSFSGTGHFSSGGGSVAQSGFGSFQQSPTQQPGGFGSAPTFGGSPAFGSPPAFGGSPAFGSGNSLSPVFGQQQVNSNFSNFANASSPTFGSLASQSPTFGNSSGFGSAPSFGATSFGGGQSPGFGGLGSPPANSSAFTQYRN